MTSPEQMTTGERITVTTAVVGMILVILGQFGVSIWWASGMASRVDTLEHAQNTVTTLQAKVDDISGRMIKQETVSDEIRRTANRVDSKLNRLLKIPGTMLDDQQ